MCMTVRIVVRKIYSTCIHIYIYIRHISNYMHAETKPQEAKTKGSNATAEDIMNRTSSKISPISLSDNVRVNVSLTSNGFEKQMHYFVYGYI